MINLQFDQPEGDWCTLEAIDTALTAFLLRHPSRRKR